MRANCPGRVQESKAGLAIGKLRQHFSEEVADAAKDLVKKWKNELELKAKQAAWRINAKAATVSKISTPTATSSNRKTEVRSSKTDKPKINVTGDKIRDKCIELLYDALAVDSSVSTDLISQRAIAIESAVLNLFGTTADYKNNIRSLFVNLRDKNNPGLRESVVAGDIPADTLSKMTSSQVGSLNKRKNAMQTDSGQLDLEEAILVSEIDLEISLRERLAATLESRIKWASLLQDALNSETADVPQVVFKDAALNALTAIDANSDILFTRENFAPVAVAHSVNNAQKGKPTPKEKPLTRSQKSKFIYLRSSPSETQGSTQIYILRCPTCLRTAFTNLQGLYNHARISHSIGWGTHEECVKTCSVLKEEVEAQVGHEFELEAGIDIGSGSALLPGVKSLFQMAVEGTRDRVAGDACQEMETGEEKSVHLTKTLGLHGDSPALAQFLGKEAKRKEIKVRTEDENAEVDIHGLDEEQRPKRRWRRPNPHLYGSRSAESGAAVVPAIEDEDLKPLAELQNGSKMSEDLATPSIQSSRFRMACRIIITDSSLFVPPKQRAETAREHTHKWMLSVESASYSIDLTTVLTSMTVTSIPLPNMDPMDFIPIPALTATEPPYLVVGTTSEPFHAQIELVFNPGGSTHGGEAQKIILEHWVGLDMLGTSKSPVKGDEQMVDVELDKDTELRPAKTGYTPTSSRVHWETKKDGEVKVENDDRTDNLKTEPGVGDAGDVPNASNANGADSNDETKPDVTPSVPDPPSNKRGRSSNANAAVKPKLPYKLVANQEELNGLVMGRRKAIEWGRAKAIRDAYTERIKESQPRIPASPSTTSPGASDTAQIPLPSVNTELHINTSLIPLTVSDVFCWLEDEGHFFREPLPAPSGDQDTAAPTEDTSKESRWAQLLQDGKWCKVCGLGLWAHGILDIPDPASVTASQSGHGRRASTAASSSALSAITFPQPTEPGLYDMRGQPVSPQSFKCDIVPASLQMSKMPMVNVQRIFSKHINRRQQHLLAEAERERWEDADMDVDVDSVSATIAPTPAPYQPVTLPLPGQGRPLYPTPTTARHMSDSQKRLRNRLLVTITDPRLIEHYRTCVASLNLRAFQLPSETSPGPEYPLSSIAASSADVDSTLASYSLLAILTKSFVKYLVKEALEVSTRDKDLGLTWMHQNHIRDVGLALAGHPTTASRRSKAATTLGGAGATGGGEEVASRGRGRAKDKEKVKLQTTRVLTPMHVMAGVVSGYVKAGSMSLAPSSTASAALGLSSSAVGPSRYVPGATSSPQSISNILSGSFRPAHGPYSSTTISSLPSQERMATAVAVFGCLARLGIGVDGFDLDLGLGSSGSRRDSF
ncbi:hypothetical protein D9758_012969 [Tetrapyrgos nigripes]|uniref:Uncharacterized protein n=1 Tax=Tetrapyrgos nigripes TaxID=182062 RepID=A0A8H5FNQ7_9AGAR|nr:hypothetical protein D9758_012969 [Tetrapyrgos nigripes]